MKVSIEGALDYAKSFGDMMERTFDHADAWASIGEEMLNSIRTNFEVGGRPTKWPDVQMDYLVKKLGGIRKVFKKVGEGRKEYAVRVPMMKKIMGNKILIASGRLLDSMTYLLIKDGVEIGTNLVYAATHQFGRGGIPARPFLLMQEEDKTMVEGIIQKYILSGEVA